MEGNLLISRKAENIIPPRSNHFTSWYMKKNYILLRKGYVPKDEVNSTINNCENWGTGIQFFLNRSIDRYQYLLTNKCWSFLVGS